MLVILVIHEISPCKNTLAGQMIFKLDGKAVRRGLISGNLLEADLGVRPYPISYFSIGKRQAAPADRRFTTRDRVPRPEENPGLPGFTGARPGTG